MLILPGEFISFILPDSEDCVLQVPILIIWLLEAVS